MQRREWIQQIQELPPVWKIAGLGLSEFNKMKDHNKLSGFKIPKRPLSSSEDSSVLSTSPTSAPIPKQKKVSHDLHSVEDIKPAFKRNGTCTY